MNCLTIIEARLTEMPTLKKGLFHWHYMYCWTYCWHVLYWIKI